MAEKDQGTENRQGENSEFERKEPQIIDALSLSDWVTLASAFVLIFSVVATYGYFDLFSPNIIRTLAIEDYFAFAPRYFYPLGQSLLFAAAFLYFLALLFWFLQRMTGWDAVDRTSPFKAPKATKRDSGTEEQISESDSEASTQGLLGDTDPASSTERMFRFEELYPNENGFQIKRQPRGAWGRSRWRFLLQLIIPTLSIVAFCAICLAGLAVPGYGFISSAQASLVLVLFIFTGIAFYLTELNVIFRSFYLYYEEQLLSPADFDLYGSIDFAIQRGESRTAGLTPETVLQRFFDERKKRLDREERRILIGCLVIAAFVGGVTYGRAIGLADYRVLFPFSELPNSATLSSVLEPSDEPVRVIDNTNGASDEIEILVDGAQLIRAIGSGVLAAIPENQTVIFINEEGKIIVEFELSAQLASDELPACVGALTPTVLRIPFDLIRENTVVGNWC